MNNHVQRAISARSFAAKSVGIGFAVLLAASSVVPAYAADDQSDVIAGLIDEVAPFVGETAQGTVTNDSVDFDGAAQSVSVPLDPAAAIVVDGHGKGGGGFTANLPEELSISNAAIATDGTIVYTGQPGTVDAAVQVLDTGSVRVQTIINSDDAPASYTYSFGDDSTVGVDQNGTHYVINSDGSFARVDDAWARDANGAKVPTSYEIDGDTLVQHVDLTGDIAFPVVADPTWTWYNAAYGVKWNKKETKQIADAGTVVGACGFITPRAPALGPVCGLYGIYLVAQATIARNDGWCVFTAVAPGPFVMRYKDSVCK